MSGALGALAGIRVLDMTRLLPGPFCSRVLVDLGAHVDKLEDVGVGDYLRNMPPMVRSVLAEIAQAWDAKRLSAPKDGLQ